MISQVVLRDMWSTCRPCYSHVDHDPTRSLKFCGATAARAWCHRSARPWRYKTCARSTCSVIHTNRCWSGSGSCVTTSPPTTQPTWRSQRRSKRRCSRSTLGWLEPVATVPVSSSWNDAFHRNAGDVPLGAMARRRRRPTSSDVDHDGWIRSGRGSVRQPTSVSGDSGGPLLLVPDTRLENVWSPDQAGLTRHDGDTRFGVVNDLAANFRSLSLNTALLSVVPASRNASE